MINKPGPLILRECFLLPPIRLLMGGGKRGGLGRGKGKRGSRPKVLLEGLRVPLTLMGGGGSGGHKSSYGGDNKKQSL